MSDATGSATEAGNPDGAAAAALAGNDTQGGGDDQGFDWAGALGDGYEGHKAMLEAKGWKQPGEALTAYGELEKLMGDKDSLLRIPGEDATDEVKAEYRAKLGIPDAPDGYQLTRPEGFENYDDSIAQWMRKTGHELGVPAAALQGIHDRYFAEVLQPLLDKDAEANKAAAEQLETDMRREWADKYDENNDVAKRGARFLGFNGDKLDELNKHVSDFALMQGMLKIGQLVGEDGLADGGRTSTANAAKDALDAFKADPDKQKAYRDSKHENHKAVVAEFNKLVEAAHPLQE